MEGLGDARGDLLGRGHEEGMLDERHRRTDDIGLLEGIGADRPGADLTGDHHQRHGVHMGIGDGGDQIGGARPGGDHADTRLTGDHGVSLGGVPRALLMTHEHVTDRIAGEQRVVEGQDGSTGHAEDVGDADPLQRAHERLGTRHQLVVLRLLGRGSVAACHPPPSSLCDPRDRDRPHGRPPPNRRRSHDASRTAGGSISHRGITNMVRT